MSKHFSSIWPIDRSYQVLLFKARVDLGAMALKAYPAFAKDPALLERRSKIV